MLSKIVLGTAIILSMLCAMFDVTHHGHFSDAEYLKKVNKLLEKSEYAKNIDSLKVGVNDRWVTLEGEIRSPEDRKTLGTEISNIPGIRGVSNLLSPEYINIPALEKIKDHLSRHPQVYEYNYMVGNDRSVTLTGHVLTEEMKQDIEELVGKVTGVKKVINKITVGTPKKKIEDIIVAILRLQNIYFDFNKATIRAESLPSIDKITNVLKEYPKAKLMIEGHTDHIGSDAYNNKLSQARADSVRNALIERGINTSRINAKGFGESRPIADNETPEGRSENRRIEFKVAE